MPRLLQRQEAPVQGRIVGRTPVCIACGNRRTFWAWRDGENRIALAWEIRPSDKIVACGRCRSRNAILFEGNDA